MHKSCPAQIKAAGTDDGLLDGQFRAVVSVFDNKDVYGDVVRPGAFADTLAEWAASGDPIPVYWSHRMDDPDYNIGYVIEAKETDQGLEVLAQLDRGPDASTKAAQVYKLLKGRRVSQFSFAYDVIDGSEVKGADGESFNELRQLKLYEVGPTPIGANPATELLAVKAADPAAAKSPDALRDALASLEAAAAHLKNVLADAGPGADETHDPDEANEPDPAKDEEPIAAKSEEPSRGASVKSWDLLINLHELEEVS